jgi:hypothetical protein
VDLTENSKNNLEDLYSRYLQFTGIMLEEYDVMEIAAVMSTQALSLYKTCMSDEDYQRMVETVYNNRNEVKTFE